MATKYEPLPGLLYSQGKRFSCPCGNSEFKVEIGPVPTRYWCECGVMYTEQSLNKVEEDSGI